MSWVDHPTEEKTYHILNDHNICSLLQQAKYIKLQRNATASTDALTNKNLTETLQFVINNVNIADLTIEKGYFYETDDL